MVIQDMIFSLFYSFSFHQIPESIQYFFLNPLNGELRKNKILSIMQILNPSFFYDESEIQVVGQCNFKIKLSYTQE